jgi:hypothetical protein
MAVCPLIYVRQQGQSQDAGTLFIFIIVVIVILPCIRGS